MQQPQRLPLPYGEAAGLPPAAMWTQGHHVQKNLAGRRVRDERHAPRQPRHQRLRVGREQLQG